MPRPRPALHVDGPPQQAERGLAVHVDGRHQVEERPRESGDGARIHCVWQVLRCVDSGKFAGVAVCPALTAAKLPVSLCVLRASVGGFEKNFSTIFSILFLFRF